MKINGIVLVLKKKENRMCIVRMYIRTNCFKVGSPKDYITLN